MKSYRLQVYVNKETKDTIFQMAKKEERSESFIAGKILENAITFLIKPNNKK